MWKRLKNKISAGGGVAVLIGAGKWIQQGGLGVPHPTPPFYWVGVALIVIGVVLGIWGWVRNPIKETEAGRYFALYDIIPILRKMDRYLWELAERKVVKHVDMEKFNHTSSRINELMGIKVNPLNPNQQVTQLINRVKSDMKKREKEVSALIAQEEKTIKLIEGITNIIDANGFGMKREKGKDKKYLRFKKIITKYYDDNKQLIDSDLQSLIKLHITISEYLANGLLVMKRIDFITKITKVPRFTELAPASTEANLEGLETKSDEQLNVIRVNIAEYIRELEKASLNEPPTEIE